MYNKQFNKFSIIISCIESSVDFVNKGIIIPLPLIEYDNGALLEHSIKCFDEIKEDSIYYILIAKNTYNEYKEAIDDLMQKQNIAYEIVPTDKEEFYSALYDLKNRIKSYHCFITSCNQIINIDWELFFSTLLNRSRSIDGVVFSCENNNNQYINIRNNSGISLIESINDYSISKNDIYGCRVYYTNCLNSIIDEIKYIRSDSEKINVDTVINHLIKHSSNFYAFKSNFYKQINLLEDL